MTILKKLLFTLPKLFVVFRCREERVDNGCKNIEYYHHPSASQPADDDDCSGYQQENVAQTIGGIFEAETLEFEREHTDGADE